MSVSIFRCFLCFLRHGKLFPKLVFFGSFLSRSIARGFIAVWWPELELGLKRVVQLFIVLQKAEAQFWCIQYLLLTFLGFSSISQKFKSFWWAENFSGQLKASISCVSALFTILPILQFNPSNWVYIRHLINGWCLFGWKSRAKKLENCPLWSKKNSKQVFHREQIDRVSGPQYGPGPNNPTKF